jgi:CRISPR-associated protein Csx10
MVNLRLTFQIAFQSDYHVGAGHGLGTEIDSALLRDGDGVLVLRGTILSGLLRDGLVELLGQKGMRHWRDEHPCQAGGVAVPNRFCGQYDDQDLDLLDMCPVCRVFGSPRMTKRWSIGSARPQGQGRVGARQLRPGDVNRQRVMRARVSPRTRRAAPRRLFSQEHGGQQVFEFVVECTADDEAALDEAALLVAGARMVRQLGRGRRRGLGECLIALTGLESKVVKPGKKGPQEWLLDRFRDRWLKRTKALAKPEAATLSAERKQGGQQVRVRVIAHTDEPLLIAQRASAGNQFRGQSAITGKTLRGALAAFAAGAFDLANDDATRLAFVALFLRSGVRFPTLYPIQLDEKEKLHPAVPVPRDGFTCKVYPGHRIQWGTLSDQNEDDDKRPDRTCQTPVSDQRSCGNAVKAVRGQYVLLSADDQKPFVPAQRNELHIRIDRDTGRVVPGQVFEYVALEAGQYFGGELICQDANAWRVLQEFLGLDPDSDEEKVIGVQLGKGRQRGYGQATLWFSKLNGGPPMWIGQPLRGAIEEGSGTQGRVTDEAQGITLTLLTDAVIADPWGRFATGFDPGWLADLLKTKNDQVKVLSAYAAIKVVDGFNSVQRLPRWRDVALAAGSSARIQVVGIPNSELLTRLEEIEKEGVGLRRNEGYGQVAFNHPVYTGCQGVRDVSVASLKVPFDLRPGETRTDLRAAFRREWEHDLGGEDWKVCAKSSALKGAFAALARWLVAHQSQPPGDLAKALDVLLADKKDLETTRAAVPEALVNTLPALGEPDNHLKDKIIEKYGARDKANKLEVAEGVKLIWEKLTSLARRADWESFWAEGVAMIAAQVADVTKRREEA